MRVEVDPSVSSTLVSMALQASRMHLGIVVQLSWNDVTDRTCKSCVGPGMAGAELFTKPRWLYGCSPLVVLQARRLELATVSLYLHMLHARSVQR